MAFIQCVLVYGISRACYVYTLINTCCICMASPQYECAYSVSTRCSVNIYIHNAGIYVHIYLDFLPYFL